MVFYWPWPALFPQHSCPPVPCVTFQRCQHSARHNSLQRRTNKVPANKPVSISQSTSMPLVKKAVKESDQQSHWLTMVQKKANTSLWMTSHYGVEKGLWWWFTMVKRKVDDKSPQYRQGLMMCHYGTGKGCWVTMLQRLIMSHKRKGWWRVTMVQRKATDESLWYTERLTMNHCGVQKGW